MGRPVFIQQNPSTTGHSSRRKLVQISFARVLAALPSCSVWGVIWLFSKGQSYRYTCRPYGLPWSGPASVCASALPAACRASRLWPFRGSFRGFWPASGTFARLPAFAPFLRPFVAFLRCLSQYVPPGCCCLLPAACCQSLKRDGRPASWPASCCFLRALRCCAYGLKTKAARLCSTSSLRP